MKGSRLLRVSLILYFLLPFILAIYFFELRFEINKTEFFWAFKNSFTQSFLASICVVTLSIPFSLGLFNFNGKIYLIFKNFLLLPQMLPTFFSILIAFSIWKPFPMGTLGICFIFVLIHLGFSVVMIHQSTKEKLGSLSLISEVFGLSRLDFFSKVYFPLLKGDILFCFLIVFIFCFSSFSIPLIASGGKDTNIEILIFEKIFINYNWSMAWTLSLIQSLFLIGLSCVLISKKDPDKKDFIQSSYLGCKFGALGLLLYLSLYVGGYLLGLVEAFGPQLQLKIFFEDLAIATSNSLKFFIVYLVLVMTILYLWMYDFVLHKKINFAKHFISASSMMVCFSFYILLPQTSYSDFVKIPVAMSILFFPMLFKSFIEKSLLQLTDQIEVAQVFGISTSQIIVNVIFRRIKKTLFVWFSVLTIWYLSDFAILRALGAQTTTLGTLAESFLSSYRLSFAYLLSLYLLFLWLVIIGIVYFFLGDWRVADK